MVEERNENPMELDEEWNVLAQQQAEKQFIRHISGYKNQIDKLAKQKYTTRENNLSTISKIATDAEQLDVLNQMNETVCKNFRYHYLCIHIIIYLCFFFVETSSRERVTGI